MGYQSLRGVLVWIHLGWALQQWCQLRWSPGEGVGQGCGVGRGVLLLPGESLVHRERMVIHHHRHHGWQEACHHLRVLEGTVLSYTAVDKRSQPEIARNGNLFFRNSMHVSRTHSTCREIVCYIAVQRRPAKSVQGGGNTFIPAPRRNTHDEFKPETRRNSFPFRFRVRPRLCAVYPQKLNTQ